LTRGVQRASTSANEVAEMAAVMAVSLIVIESVVDRSSPF
jgi:hypothetical protein